MPEPRRPLKVFLCHASADKPKVRELYRTLKRRGIQPWLDAENLIPGQNWEVEIPKALLSSDVIVICLSPNSVDKEGYVQKEIKFALDKAMEMPEGRIFLIPARLEDCDLPYGLRQYQAVDLYEKEGYVKLMKALKLRATQLERNIVELPKEGEITPEIREGVEEKKGVGIGSLKATDSEDVIKIGIQEKSIPKKATIESFQPKKPGPGRRLNIALVFVLIGFVGIIILKMLWWPLFSPTHVPTETSTATIAAALRLVAPSQTMKPGLPLTKTITPAATFLPIETTDTKGISMRLVPASDFRMGYSADDANSFCQTILNNMVNYGFPCRKENYLREEPEHKVYLSNYFIDVYEVSNENYEKCVLERVCTQPSKNSANRYSIYYGNENFREYPVVYVTWDMAKTYCEWRDARLPTEAEWEKAARGTDGRTHPWENYNSAYRLYDPTFYINKANLNLGTSNKATMPVDANSKGLSPFGLYNMAGNVAEWVSDWYSETYYRDAPSVNPPGPSSGEYKVIRGGSVNTFEIRTSARDYLNPSESNASTGFRCAKDATQ